MKESDKEALIDWIAKMIVFWSISALLYFAVIHDSTLSWWILGSLFVLQCLNMVKDNEKDSAHDKDN
jgi:hypothetical protein